MASAIQTSASLPAIHLHPTSRAYPRPTRSHAPAWEHRRDAPRRVPRLDSPTQVVGDDSQQGMGRLAVGTEQPPRVDPASRVRHQADAPQVIPVQVVHHTTRPHRNPPPAVVVVLGDTDQAGLSLGADGVAHVIRGGDAALSSPLLFLICKLDTPETCPLLPISYGVLYPFWGEQEYLAKRIFQRGRRIIVSLRDSHIL